MREVNIPLKDNRGFMKVIAYSVNEYINSEDIQILQHCYVKKKGYTKDGKPDYYLNVPITFDIETSSYDIEGDKKQRVSWMYIWQMTINGIVIIGRTWNDWLRLLYNLKKIAKVDNKHKAIIFVQNLAYEYQFIHSRLPVDEIFAREARKVITMSLKDELEGFKFECTYSISGYSLAKIAENTLSCPITKMKGDLDYTKVRTKYDILTDEEFIYCVNDVLILDYYIKDLIKNETNQCVGNIPITKTGFVRRDARNSFARDKEYQKFYQKQKLDAHQFIMYCDAYRGGDTHAQALWCGEIIDDVYSFDLTSSYPYRIIAEEFPLSKPITIEEPNISHLEYLENNDKLFIIDLTITNVKWKGLGYFTYIPLAKCKGVNEYKVENGRITEAKALRLTVTSVDFELMRRNYDFEISKIYSIVYHLKKGLLPKSFRDYVIKLYKAKTTLKNVKGQEVEYMQSKERVNSIYGMCVTNPLNDEVFYDDEYKEWVRNQLPKIYENEDKIQKELDSAYRSRNHFLAYEVGVWISAFARYDLHRALSILGTDAVYWDTDSCKFVNKENYKVFEKLNNDKKRKLLSLDYEEDEISPMDIKGKRHTIGLWDEEYPDGVTFKTFGAKKYFYNENGEGHITVAGLNKKTASEYLTNVLGDITNIELGQEIPEEYSGRTYSIYNDYGFNIELKGIEISEKSYVSIVPTTYILGDVEEHLLFIMLNKEKIKERS